MLKVRTGRRGQPPKIDKLFAPLVRFFNRPSYWARGEGLRRLTATDWQRIDNRRQELLAVLRSPAIRGTSWRRVAKSIRAQRQRAADVLGHLGSSGAHQLARFDKTQISAYPDETEVVLAEIKHREQETGERYWRPAALRRVVEETLQQLDAHAGQPDLSERDARSRREAVAYAVATKKTLEAFQRDAHESKLWARDTGRYMAALSRWEKNPVNLRPPRLTAQEKDLLASGGFAGVNLALGRVQWRFEAALALGVRLTVCDYCSRRVFIRKPREGNRKDCDICRRISASTRWRHRENRVTKTRE